MRREVRALRFRSSGLVAHPWTPACSQIEIPSPMLRPNTTVMNSTISLLRNQTLIDTFTQNKNPRSNHDSSS